MATRPIAIAAAVLLQVFAGLLVAQTTERTPAPTNRPSRQQLAKALLDYREKQDAHGEAVTLLQLGIAEAEAGNVDGARSNLADAVKKMRAQNDLMGTWLALMVSSQLEIALGRSAEAIPHLEKALVVLSEAKSSTAPFGLETFKAVGTSAGFAVQIPPGLDDASVAALKPVLIQFSLEPMTHDLYGSVLTQVGQLEKAETELKAAVAGAVYAQGMYDFSIESHVGDLRFRQQRYDEARTHYMKALNSSSSTQLPMGGQLIKAGIYDRLARLEMASGHPDDAKRWADKARSASKGRTDR